MPLPFAWTSIPLTRNIHLNFFKKHVPRVDLRLILVVRIVSIMPSRSGKPDPSVPSAILRMPYKN